MSPLWLAAGAAAIATGVMLVTAAFRRPVVDIASVLDDLDAPLHEPIDGFEERLREPLAPRLLRPAGERVAWAVRGLLPRNHLARRRETLVRAGLGERITPEEFLALQLGGLLGVGSMFTLLGLVAGWGPAGLSRAAGIGAVLGLVLPINWVQRTRERRITAVRRDLPDVLDLMAISVEAGVGLEGAIEVVTEHFHTPVAVEMGRMLREMELGLPRRAALQNLKARLDVPEVSGFVLSLVQADALGMPLTKVLHAQAREGRARRRQWARERAARLPVKIVFPLMVFILPALFVVVIGPAVMSIAENVL